LISCAINSSNKEKIEHPMTPDQQQDPTPTTPKTELSPGKLLATAREQAGLSQEDVARELYMTLTKVRALEGDDYARLHSDTFIRGYLRAYANLLKIDIEYIVAAYDEQAQRLGLVEVFVPKAPESSSKKTWLFVVFVAIVLLVLWLISVWFFDNKKEPDYPLPAALVVPLETVSPMVSSASSAAADSDSSMGISVPVVITDSQTSSAANDQVIAVSAHSIARSTVAATSSLRSYDSAEGLDELVFVFTEECWLEVSDSQGDVLATQLEPAGSQVTIKGHAPFDVKVGNAQGVSIKLNGKAVKLVPSSGTNVRVIKISN
jgi:cytoskeleton protein RodZ